MSTITIELPDAILEALQAHGLDVKRFILEAIGVEGYRRGVLTHKQVGELLAFDDRQTQEFLTVRLA